MQNMPDMELTLMGGRVFFVGSAESEKADRTTGSDVQGASAKT